jgi:hypothetical protein
MLHLPARFAAVILPFAAMCVQQRTWQHAQVLLLGALLAPGQRTVCGILRIVGLRRERHFVTYHRVLNRAGWHSRRACRVLLGLLLRAFVPSGPVWMTPSSAGVANGSAPKASTAIRCARRSPSSSRPVACVGLA